MKNELLLPGGSVEKIKYAIAYGADAVYFGVEDYSLRQMRKGEVITLENLSSTIDYIHDLGKKAYLTLNIFAFDEDLQKLEKDIEQIVSANPDALIISDFGIFQIVKKYIGKVDLHISTQTNTLNTEAVKFWQGLGASRVILARELSYERIKKIREKVPDIELEMFVHGAQCMSFSGRCLLSDYMTNGERKANRGQCAQPCRWSYKLLEQTRPNQYYEIIQDNRGSHILSTKDLALINYMKSLCELGIDSFKIEGRTKSLYYVSSVARAYRSAIDRVLGKDKTNIDENLFDELKKIGNRGYTTGFFIPEKNPSDAYSYDISKGLAGADFLFEVKNIKEGKFQVKIKNKVFLHQEIEIITPKNNFVCQVCEILNEKGENLEIANTNDLVWMKFSCQIDDQDLSFALARTIEVKR